MIDPRLSFSCAASSCLSTDCLDEAAVQAFSQGELDGPQLQGLDQHLADCEACFARVLRRCAVQLFEPSAAALASQPTRSRVERVNRLNEPLLPTPYLPAARFERGELIGRGGMGIVYRGTDTHTGRAVAIKVIAPGVATEEPTLRYDLAQEAAILSQVTHPNIVGVVGIIADLDQVLLVMEYVDGGTLRQALQRGGPLGVDRALRIGLEMCDALARVHHLRLLHRDIKPENVLLTRDGTVRLADFGLAHAQQPDHSGLGGLSGTLAYCSPEALQGESLGIASDLWAVGVVLFEMLTGFRPFDGPGKQGVVRAILERRMPDLGAACPSAPAALIDLIGRLLERRPRDRLASARQAAAELEAISRSGTAPLAHHGLLQ